MLDEGGFIELTFLYHAEGTDPRAAYDRSQKRLMSLANVRLIYPDSRGNGFSVVVSADGGLFIVAEPYEYLTRILSGWQPRPADSIVARSAT